MRAGTGFRKGIRIPAIAAVALFIAAQVLLFLVLDNEQKPTTKTLPIAAIACLAGSVALGLLALRHANRK